jgi:hypothetical protein
MKLDNETVLAGDVVFDLVFGSGVVSRILEAEGSFQVNFGEKIYTYKPTGVGHFSQRTLYWRDPIAGLVPNKNDVKWDYFCQLRNALAQVVWKEHQNAN